MNKPIWNDVFNLKNFVFFVALTFLILILNNQIALLNYFEWGDESETIVAAKMLASGMRLYSEIFNHHGPLTFLTGYALEKIGNFDIPAHRLVVVALQWIGLSAIYFSPLIKNTITRVFLTGIVGAAIVIYLPELYGHMYKYQVLAAILIMVVLSQFVIPAILLGGHVAVRNIFVGCFLLACLPFLAITYLPASIIFFLSALRKERVWLYFLAFGSGVFFNLLFLSMVGSLSGYAAYHLYLNSQILPEFNGGQSVLQMISVAYNLATGNLQSAILFLTIGVSAVLISQGEQSRIPWRTMLLSIGVGSLLLRGVGFHGIPYIYACFALLVPIFANIKASERAAVLMYFLFSCIIFLKLFNIDRENIKKYQIRPTEFSSIAKLITNRDDKIVAYSFQNYQYIAAERLPASTHYFYLPMQERYNEKPVFGIKSDACEEISRNKPKIIMLDKWNVWDRYPWESYGSCIDEYVGLNYQKIINRPYYLRKDLLPHDLGLDLDGGGYELQFTTAENSQLALPLHFSRSHIVEKLFLDKLMIRLGTFGKSVSGLGRVYLQEVGGDEVLIEFQLNSIKNNEYLEVDVPEGIYSTGYIRFDSTAEGGRIEKWVDIEPFDLTDQNWVNGISRNSAGFFVARSKFVEDLLFVGAKISISNSEERRVMKIDKSNEYVNVYLDGEALNPSMVVRSGGIRVLAPSNPKVALWEVSRESHKLTCVVYRYADGKVRFTPGCPVN